MADYSNLPDFDSLPPVENMPQGCAWGIFDNDGKKDHLGCLNLLTPKVVQEAYKEARDGVSISLNWPNRTVYRSLGGGKPSRTGNKTRVKKERGYGVKFSYNSRRNTIANRRTNSSGRPWVDRYLSLIGSKDLRSRSKWYRRYAPVAGSISARDIQKSNTNLATHFKHGDILLVRTGYTDDLSSASSGDAQEALLNTGAAIGVEGTIATARWFWNHHFAAVAGDAPVFEAVPPRREDGTEGTNGDLVLHSYFLSLFGLNIGEFFDLKALGEHCKAVGRYEFLLTSAPLNISGLVGSPPNALALF
ncbi:hypothetical protein F5882DRAFT_308229 [Hyaloscypha sp. PMI_1271]|nr:hypothetical protein F5882DRAFT_308229 [Hyaloscypha sp. PMI_1271]